MKIYKCKIESREVEIVLNDEDHKHIIIIMLSSWSLLETC